MKTYHCIYQELCLAELSYYFVLEALQLVPTRQEIGPPDR